jgi:hypothetical protein
MDAGFPSYTIGIIIKEIFVFNNNLNNARALLGYPERNDY